MNTHGKMHSTLQILLIGVVGLLLGAVGYWLGKTCQFSNSSMNPIGVVDVQLVYQAPKVMALNRQVISSFQPQQTEFMKLKADYDRKNSEFLKNKVLWDEEKIQEQTQLLAQQEKLFKEKQESFMQMLSKAQSEFQEKLRPIYAKIAQKNGLKILLAKGNEAGGDMILHANAELNLTHQVLQLIESDF
jgi:Skp family chaperone for outer membrane proteins